MRTLNEKRDSFAENAIGDSSIPRALTSCNLRDEPLQIERENPRIQCAKIFVDTFEKEKK